MRLGLLERLTKVPPPPERGRLGLSGVAGTMRHTFMTFFDLRTRQENVTPEENGPKKPRRDGPSSWWAS